MPLRELIKEFERIHKEIAEDPVTKELDKIFTELGIQDKVYVTIGHSVTGPKE